MKCLYLNYDQRKKIEALYASGASHKAIAADLRVCLTTVYRELERGRCGSDLDHNGRIKYSAEVAQKNFLESLKNRGKIKAVRVGKQYRIPKEALAEFEKSK